MCVCVCTESGGDNISVIIGAVVGVLLLVIIVGVIVGVVLMQKRKPK